MLVSAFRSRPGAIGAPRLGLLVANDLKRACLKQFRKEHGSDVRLAVPENYGCSVLLGIFFERVLGGNCSRHFHHVGQSSAGTITLLDQAFLGHALMEL